MTTSEMYYCQDCGKEHRRSSLIGKYHSNPIYRTVFKSERCYECADPFPDISDIKLVVWSRLHQLPKYAPIHSACLEKYLSCNKEFEVSCLNWIIKQEDELRVDDKL